MPRKRLWGPDLNPFTTHRRGLLAATLALAFAPALARAATSTSTATLKVADRDLELTIVRPDAPRGVVIFSHGAGGAPDGYAALLDVWAKAGFLVVAPLHVDSLKHPDHAKYDLRAAFPARLADLAAASAYVTHAAPGLPVAAAGHSYGALMSMIRGGALEGMIPAQDPTVKAVLCFSDAGVVKGLIGPTAYAGLKKPMLMITGDKDVMPGMFDDWRDHLYAFETSAPGDKYAWIGKGVDHGLAHHKDDPAFAEASSLSLTFLQAHVLDDAAAKPGLAARGSTAMADWKTR